MKDQKVIGFMRLRTFATALSLILIVGFIISLATKGIEWGLDFTGGTVVELLYDKPVKTEDVRVQLEGGGFADAVVQEFGSAQSILLRIPGDDQTAGAEISKLLNQNYEGDLQVLRVEFVGPQVGAQLRDQGGLGMLMALGLVMLYIAFRFQLKFSVGAVVALAHDVILILGLFSVFGLQFDLTVLAAILAIVGYSLNDTIIIYDRIRENFRKVRNVAPSEIIDLSLTQTLGRTLATSGTTLMVLASLFLFGGEAVHNFSTALLMGVTVGTYSSIYIASNALLMMNISRDDLIVPVRESDELDDRP